MATIADADGGHRRHNRAAWDARARAGQSHTQPASDAALADPLRALDAEGWLGPSIAGQRVLCLASGGGLQSVLCAAAGAEVTVLDLSPAMLDLDRAEARQRGVRVRCVEGSIDRPLEFGSGVFDVVLQPVSTCYVPDVALVFAEVARVLAPGGLYISQHKQPVSLQVDGFSPAEGYCIRERYRRSGPLPRGSPGQEHREPDTLEYLHTLEALFGGLCAAGFAIEGLVEPVRGDPDAPPGTFRHRSLFVPPYLKVKARRQNRAGPPEPTSPRLWVPS